MAQAEAPVSAQPLCGADECDQLVPKPYDDGWSTHLGAGCDDARACRVSLATLACPCVVWGQLYEKVARAPGAGRAVAIASGVAGVLLVATPYLAYLDERDDDDSAYYDGGGVVVVTRNRPASALTAYYLGFVELALLSAVLCLVVTIRQRVRERDAIPERCCETNPGTEDCGVVAACLCCATYQMVRHELGDHEGGRPYYLCSPLDSKA